MLDQPKSKLVAKWSYEIDQYDQRMQNWNKRADDITKRYTDQRKGITETNNQRFNAFWSNIQTQMPAMYAQVPKPEIDRRFKDADPVGRSVAELLQRCASFALSSQDAHPVFKQSVLDYLLCARGVLWVRYHPSFKDIELEADSAEVEDDGLEVTPDESEAEDTEQDDGPLQDLDFEEVPVDYVHRKDFGHTEARNWEEVRAVWRKVFLTRKELVARFGDVGERVPLNYTPDGESKAADVERDKKAVIYEVWDRTEKRVYWICKDFEHELDERDDPLRLRRFFPCPKPLFGTLTNDDLEPVPDFVMYQDQLNMLDELTARITMVTKSLKVAGCYDASAPALQRILNEGVENTLIPVDSWAAFGEKGGLKGSMEFLPIQEIAEALLSMYQAREHVKNDMYEITGLSDIMRGDTDADETATAQKLKGSFAGMRFSDRRTDVQRFLREVIQIMVEIIAEHFDVETLKKMSGLQMFDTVAEKNLAQQMYTPPDPSAQPAPPQPPQGAPGMMGMPGSAPPAGPPPTPDEIMEQKLDNPTWEEVMALMHDDSLRTFRIEIETDSTVRADEEADREAALEYIKTMGDLIEKAAPMIQATPKIAPVLGEMIMFASRRFKIGRQLEGELETFIENMKKLAANPPPPQPPLELQVIQAKGQVDQQNIMAKGKVDQANIQAKGQVDLNLDAHNATGDAAKSAMEAQIDQDRVKADSQSDALRQHFEAMQTAMQNKLEAQREQQQAAMDQQTAMFQARIDAQAATVENQFKLLIASLQARTQVEVAEIGAQSALDTAQVSAAKAGTESE